MNRPPASIQAMQRLLLVSLVLPLLVLAACGGDKKDSAPGTAGADATPGVPLSDEAYLRGLCTGLTRYLETANTAKTKEDIGKELNRYIDDLKKLTPPADAASFHTAYLAYLEGARDDPTKPLATKPPVPEKDVRERLAKKQKDVAECKPPTFLDGE